MIVGYTITTDQEQVRVGKTITVTVNVADLRPQGEYPYNNEVKPLIRGVYAAYIGLYFDKAYASTGIDPTYTPARQAWAFRNACTFYTPYTNGKLAVEGPFGVSRIGAFSTDFDGLDPDSVYPVVSFKLIALKVGQLVIQSNTRSLKYPMDDTLVYGNLAATPIEHSYVHPSAITIGRAVVDIIA